MIELVVSKLRDYKYCIKYYDGENSVFLEKAYTTKEAAEKALHKLNLTTKWKV